MKALRPATKTDTARFFGVSTKSIDNWISDGCPVAERDTAGRVKRLSIPEVFTWKLENHVPKYWTHEAAHDAMLKLEVSELGQDLADRLPDFIEGCVKTSGHNDARYGAKCAFGLLISVVCERFKEGRTYFEFPDFES